MKFLIDENLSPDLCEIFQKKGFLAHHINQFKKHQKHRIKDDQLRHLSLFKDYIIVSKDDDFVKSFVNRKVPKKLIFIYELNTKPELINRIADIINHLVELIENHDFIEVNNKEIRLPFD